MDLRLFEKLLDLIYPPVCFNCGLKLSNHGSFFLCEYCSQEIDFIRKPVCRICGSPGIEGTCIRCLGVTRSFSSAFSSCEYHGVVSEGIKLFKFGGNLWLAETLCRIFEVGLREHPELAASDLIVPVPLSRHRRKTRGFNQSEILASHASKVLKKPVSKGNLIRIKNSVPQTELSAGSRAKNVKGIFAVRKPEEIEGRAVLLVDDVFTTGSTVNECAVRLVSSGARSVKVYTLSRRC